MKKNLKVEAEGSELVLKNKVGDYVIIPKDKRASVQDMLSRNCNSCIDSLVETLPTMANYAVDGTVMPSEDPVPKPKTNAQQMGITRQFGVTDAEGKKSTRTKPNVPVSNPEGLANAAESTMKTFSIGNALMAEAYAGLTGQNYDFRNTIDVTPTNKGGKQRFLSQTTGTSGVTGFALDMLDPALTAVLVKGGVKAGMKGLGKFAAKNAAEELPKITDNLAKRLTDNKNWKKYITQEEKVERMLAQKDKIKKATSSENILSFEEKINPFQVEDTGLGYKSTINLSKSGRQHKPGMTYDEFENAAKTWTSKRNDALAGDMNVLGSARHNDYWGISKDFEGLPEDADALRKLAYNKFYASGTPEQKLIVENAIKNHELDHFLYKNSRKEYDDIIKAFDPDKFGISARYLKGRQSSNAGDELRARMAQLMDYFEFKVNPKTGKIEDILGNTKFTQEHLDYARKNYIKDTNLDNTMSSFFNGIIDDKKFIDIMNKTALSTVPIMAYLKSKNKKDKA